MGEVQPRPFGSTRCRGCDRVCAPEERDEFGWCPECQEQLARQTRWGRHLVAGVIVLPFAVWVLLVEKAAFLPFYAWLLPLAAAYYLGLRIGREALKGYARWRQLR